jgi:uncharacterized protein YcbK (DUF882 family)
MTPTQWETVRHFDPSENWGDPSMMDCRLILELDRLRHYIGRRIVVHCGYEARDGKGFHPLGKAVDCHAVGLHPVDFYVAASRFDFGGIGLYLWWNAPGLHLDTRPREGEFRALWGSTGPKIYVPFDRDFLTEAMQI